MRPRTKYACTCFISLWAVSYPAQLASEAASSIQLYISLVHVSDLKRAHIKEHQNWPRVPGRLNNDHKHFLAQGLTSMLAAGHLWHPGLSLSQNGLVHNKRIRPWALGDRNKGEWHRYVKGHWLPGRVASQQLSELDFPALPRVLAHKASPSETLLEVCLQTLPQTHLMRDSRLGAQQFAF